MYFFVFNYNINIIILVLICLLITNLRYFSFISVRLTSFVWISNDYNSVFIFLFGMMSHIVANQIKTVQSWMSRTVTNHLEQWFNGVSSSWTETSTWWWMKCFEQMSFKLKFSKHLNRNKRWQNCSCAMFQIICNKIYKVEWSWIFNAKKHQIQ